MTTIPAIDEGWGDGTIVRELDTAQTGAVLALAQVPSDHEITRSALERPGDELFTTLHENNVVCFARWQPDPRHARLPWIIASAGRGFATGTALVLMQRHFRQEGALDVGAFPNSALGGDPLHKLCFEGTQQLTHKRWIWERVVDFVSSKPSFLEAVKTLRDLRPQLS